MTLWPDFAGASFGNLQTRTTANSGGFGDTVASWHSQSQGSLFTLHEAGCWANGLLSLASFVQDTGAWDSVGLAVLSVQSYGQTARVIDTGRRIQYAIVDGTQTQFEGSADFTTTLGGLATLAQVVQGRYSYGDHLAGSTSAGQLAVSSLAFDLQASGTQLLGLSNQDGSLSTGSNGGTFNLGEGVSFQGVGDFTHNAYGWHSGLDTQLFSWVEHGAGTASYLGVSLACFSLLAESRHCLSYAGGASSGGSVNGTEGLANSFSGRSSASEAEGLADWSASSLSLQGAYGGLSWGLSVRVDLSAYSCYGYDRGSTQTWATSVRSGTNSFDAHGSATSSVSLQAVGSWSGDTYTFSGFTLQGGSLGTATTNEGGSMDSTTYGHTRRWAGWVQESKIGSYGGFGGFSYSSYATDSASLSSASDSVGGRSDNRDSWQREQLTGTSATSGVQTVTSGSVWSNSGGSGSSAMTTTDASHALGAATVVQGLVKPEQLLSIPPGVSLAEEATPLMGPSALPAQPVRLYGAAGALPVATAAWQQLPPVPGPGSGWQVQIGAGAGQAIILVGDQLGAKEAPTVLPQITTLLGQGLHAASLVGFSPTARWTWFGAGTPAVWTETSNAYVKSWALAVPAQPSGDPLMMPDGKRGAGGGDKGLSRSGGFWDFIVGAAQSVSSFVVGLANNPMGTMLGVAGAAVEWLGSQRDNILGAMQWLGDHALNPFGALGELGAWGLYQVGSGIAWALEKTGEGLGDMAVSFLEYGHAVGEFASSLSQVGHAKDTGGDLVDDFDKMLVGRLRAQANGFDVGSLTAGDLPIYGLDGNQTVSQAAGSLRQGLEQAGALVAGGVQLAAQVLAFTPVGTAVMVAQTAIQLAQGDVVGAALSVGQIFVMHGVNSVSASFGVSNLGALPARAINFPPALPWARASMPSIKSTPLPAATR